MKKRQHARSILSEETLDNKFAIRSISAKTFRAAITGNLYVTLLFETIPVYDLKQLQQADCTTLTEPVKQC